MLHSGRKSTDHYLYRECLTIKDTQRRCAPNTKKTLVNLSFPDRGNQFSPTHQKYPTTVLGTVVYATTMDISCCYSLPTVVIHRRALATTAVCSLQQQWRLPAKRSLHHNIVSGSEVFIAYQAVLPLPPSKNPDDGGTAALPVIQRWLSPSPHRTPPCALLLVSARLQNDWLHKHGPSPPSLPFVT